MSFQPITPISTCIASLRNVGDILGRLAIINSATVDVSPSAKLTDFQGYAVDTGNYDMCMRQPQMWHCLAGSIKKTGEVDDAFGGVCIPRSCTPDILLNDDVRKYFSESISSLISDSSNTLTTPRGQQLFEYYLKLNHTLSMAEKTKSSLTCGDHSANMTIDRYLFFIIFAVLIITVITCTIYHMATSGWDLESLTYLGQSSSRINLSEQNQSSSNSPAVPNSKISRPNHQQLFPDSAIVHHLTPSPVFTRIVESFSLVKNIGYIFETHSVTSTEVMQDRFPILDGLRAISILWIILSHTLAVSLSVGMLNPAAVLPPEGFLRKTSAQVFFCARFAVDTFFFISGFLVSFTLLKRLSPIHNNNSGTSQTGAPPSIMKWLPQFYIHRILRILPPYVFCLVLWWKIGVLLGTGPFWFRWLSYTRRCDFYWWTNLFFINNLFPYDSSEVDQCFYVSWYLANDMQFYFVSPLFLYIYLHNNRIGLLITGFACICSMALTGFMTYSLDLSPHTFDGIWVTKYSRAMYTKPQYRISVYLIGVIAGMVWHMKRRLHPRLKIHPSLSKVYLLGSSIVILWLIFGSASAYQRRPCKYLETSGHSCGSNWSLWARVAYNTFARPLWALCLAIITLLSGNGQGGPIQSFLSHPFWCAPAKVSFSVFLLHVFIINIWFLGRTQKPRYSHFDFAMSYCGVVFMSFVCGLFVTVFVESPSTKLWSAVQENFLKVSHIRIPRNIVPIVPPPHGQVFSINQADINSNHTERSHLLPNIS